MSGQVPKLGLKYWKLRARKHSQTQQFSEAPNENIAQNHLYVALLTYFSIKTVDIGIFLSSNNFSSVRIS